MSAGAHSVAIGPWCGNRTKGSICLFAIDRIDILGDHGDSPGKVKMFDVDVMETRDEEQTAVLGIGIENMFEGFDELIEDAGYNE